MQTISLDRAVAMIPMAPLMIGGFMAVGTPEKLMDELVRQGRKNLTVIANDNALPGDGDRHPDPSLELRAGRHQRLLPVGERG